MVIFLVSFGLHAQTCDVVVVKQQDVGCIQGLEGNIQVKATGNAPFSYTWNTGKKGSVLENVPAGTYTVTVKDAKGCVANKSVTIKNTPQRTIEAIVKNNNIEIKTTGFSNITEYTIVRTDQKVDKPMKQSNKPFFENLEKGTYLVIAKDKNECFSNITTVIR
jgi:hypothetical protein